MGQEEERKAQGGDVLLRVWGLLSFHTRGKVNQPKEGTAEAVGLADGGRSLKLGDRKTQVQPPSSRI